MKKVLPKPKRKSRLTFNEAKKFLKGYIDLDKEKELALKRYQKWGLTTALIKVGLIKDKTDLERKFNEVNFSYKKLSELKKIIQEEGEEIVALFIPPFNSEKFNLRSLYQVLFEKQKIGRVDLDLEERILSARLDEILEIPLNKIPWHIIYSLPFYKQEEILQKSYTSILKKSIKPKPFQIKFVISGIKPDRTNSFVFSFKKDLPKFYKNSIKLIDPFADFILRRIQNDNIKKFMPSYGNSIATIYFVFILPNGRLVGSQWDRMPDRRFKLSLNDWFLPQQYSSEENFGLRTIY